MVQEILYNVGTNGRIRTLFLALLGIGIGFWFALDRGFIVSIIFYGIITAIILFFIAKKIRDEIVLTRAQ